MKKTRQRQPQPPISEEMKAWSTALANEAADWPDLTPRSFFGFTALYRRERMFAVLPRSRNLESANTIAFKFESPTVAVQKQLSSDLRIGSIDRDNTRWCTFLLSSNADLHDALDWLAQAYEAVAKIKKSR